MTPDERHPGAAGRSSTARGQTYRMTLSARIRRRNQTTELRSSRRLHQASARSSGSPAAFEAVMVTVAEFSTVPPMTSALCRMAEAVRSLPAATTVVPMPLITPTCCSVPLTKIPPAAAWLLFVMAARFVPDASAGIRAGQFERRAGRDHGGNSDAHCPRAAEVDTQLAG